MTPSKKADPLVGRAFRCDDGIVRWIIARSSRANYRLLWLDEKTGVWFQGGAWPVVQWVGGEEVPTPRPGETYKLAGVFGGYREVAA